MQILLSTLLMSRIYVSVTSIFCFVTSYKRRCYVVNLWRVNNRIGHCVFREESKSDSHSYLREIMWRNKDVAFKLRSENLLLTIISQWCHIDYVYGVCSLASDKIVLVEATVDLLILNEWLITWQNSSHI